MRFFAALGLCFCTLTACDFPETTPQPSAGQGPFARVLSSVGSCSALPITDTDLLATAAHCLPDTRPEDVEVTVSGERLRTLDAWRHPDWRPSLTDSSTDVALIRVDRRFASDGFSARLTTPPGSYDTISFTGWPPSPDTKNDSLTPEVCSVSTSRIETNRYGITLPCPSSPGSSGSGVVATVGSERYLVGVVSRGDSPAFTVVAPSAAFSELPQANGA